MCVEKAASDYAIDSDPMANATLRETATLPMPVYMVRGCTCGFVGSGSDAKTYGAGRCAWIKSSSGIQLEPAESTKIGVNITAAVWFWYVFIHKYDQSYPSYVCHYSISIL